MESACYGVLEVEFALCRIQMCISLEVLEVEQ